MKELAMQAIALLKKAHDSGQLAGTLVGGEIEDWLNQASIFLNHRNIVLGYNVAVQHGSDVYFANGCEVFTDEQSVQWVKFVAKNGYRAGSEHMIRTDQVIIVRRDDLAAA
jgi:hypothetical protein